MVGVEILLMVIMSKNIWIYWSQGFGIAPALVSKCVQTWSSLNPDYTIRLLDSNNISEYLDLTEVLSSNRIKKASFAAKSDLIRVNLLAKHGGIWVDSTLMCLHPLDEWLIPDHPFFAFSNPGPDRMISSWFLSAEPSSYIIKKWRAESQQYWSRWKLRRKYYWFHYLFGDLYQSDERFKQEWDSSQKIEADGAHILTPFREKFFEQATEEKIAALHNARHPVLKLTYKCIKDGYPEGSMIDYLLNKM